MFSAGGCGADDAFTRDLGPVLTYFSYLLSAYALVIGIDGLVRFITWTGLAVPNTRLMRTMLTTIRVF